jgi:acyl carrier protein
MSHEATIKQFIITEFLPDVRPDELRPDYDLIASGVIDSLSLLRVITWLGSHFGIPIDDIEIAEEYFASVAAIDDFVSRQQSSIGGMRA